MDSLEESGYTTLDVLCGRGGGTNHHVGNKDWRKLVEETRREYIRAPRSDKAFVAVRLVQTIREKGGRFLEKEKGLKTWKDIGDERAIRKTSQALREKAPLIRLELERGDEITEEEVRIESSGDETTDNSTEILKNLSRLQILSEDEDVSPPPIDTSNSNDRTQTFEAAEPPGAFLQSDFLDNSVDLELAETLKELFGDDEEDKKVTKRNRKSIARERPEIKVQPKESGPVLTPNKNDVLNGRGGRVNSHSGNEQFRSLVYSKLDIYFHESTGKLDKGFIAKGIVTTIRSMNPPGRFLEKEERGDYWWEIGDKRAITKILQAIREKSPHKPKVPTTDETCNIISPTDQPSSASPKGERTHHPHESSGEQYPEGNEDVADKKNSSKEPDTKILVPQDTLSSNPPANQSAATAMLGVVQESYPGLNSFFPLGDTAPCPAFQSNELPTQGEMDQESNPPKELENNRKRFVSWASIHSGQSVATMSMSSDFSALTDMASFHSGSSNNSSQQRRGRSQPGGLARMLRLGERVAADQQEASPVKEVPRPPVDDDTSLMSLATLSVGLREMDERSVGDCSMVTAQQSNPSR